MNSIYLILFLPYCNNVKEKTEYQIRDKRQYTDFQIIYDINEKDNYFSSFDSTFSRQYMDGNKELKVFLTIKEKQQILKMCEFIDFFSLPSVIVEDRNGESMSII